jgi:hypothetical protein
VFSRCPSLVLKSLRIHNTILRVGVRTRCWSERHCCGSARVSALPHDGVRAIQLPSSAKLLRTTTPVTCRAFTGPAIGFHPLNAIRLTRPNELLAPVPVPGHHITSQHSLRTSAQHTSASTRRVTTHYNTAQTRQHSRAEETQERKAHSHELAQQPGCVEIALAQ